jgi:hypothetical protein
VAGTSIAERTLVGRLHVIVDGESDQLLDAVLAGGAPVVQLRMKEATDRKISGGLRPVA